MKHILEADSIQLSFKSRVILSDVYIKCETERVTGILGRNGQGKSCLLRIIYGSLKSDDRSVRFDGVANFQAFTSPHLLTYLPQFNFIPKSLSLQRIFEDFEMDFSGFEKIFPEFLQKHKEKLGELSGGACRLVEVYAILFSNSLFSMLDEPFTHLSPVQIEKVSELIIEAGKKKGLLITDHMYKYVLDLCDTLYVLSNGKLFLTKNVNDIERLGYLKNV